MKSYLIQAVLVFCLAVLLNKANAGGFGPCPSAPVEYNDFNATKFRGLWYLYSASNGYYDAYPNECRTDLIMSKTNKTEDFAFTAFSSIFDHETNRTQRYGKTITAYGETDPKLSMWVEGSYWPYTMTVMKTDHFSYAILHVCRSIGLYHWDHFEVITRDKLPSKYHRHMIGEETKKFGYHHKTDFRRSPNIECYKPDPQRKN